MATRVLVRGAMLGLLLASAPWLLGGCGDSVNQATTGTLRVALTDQSGTYSSVVLAVREVRLVPLGSEAGATGQSMPLVASFSPARTIDVLSLAFQQQLLGEALVPVGTYHQLRLVLEANPAGGPPVNYVTRVGDPTQIALRTPSGHESGLKINGRFTVAPGVLNAIVLDFDPARAIVEAGGSGNLNLKPTGIRLVQMSQVLTQYGSLSGTVNPPAAWASAVVHVYATGSSTPAASGSVNPDDGSFRAFVPTGSYYLRVVAPGYATYDSQQQAPPANTFGVVVGVDVSVGALVLAAN